MPQQIISLRKLPTRLGTHLLPQGALYCLVIFYRIELIHSQKVILCLSNLYHMHHCISIKEEPNDYTYKCETKTPEYQRRKELKPSYDHSSCLYTDMNKSEYNLFPGNLNEQNQYYRYFLLCYFMIITYVVL